MTLIPAFEIGAWNAWIPLLVSLIPVFFIPLITKSREKGVNFTAAFDKKCMSPATLRQIGFREYPTL